jgi:hypothetical protein
MAQQVSMHLNFAFSMEAVINLAMYFELMVM